jgi:hypothetical protein
VPPQARAALQRPGPGDLARRAGLRDRERRIPRRHVPVGIMSPRRRFDGPGYRLGASLGNLGMPLHLNYDSTRTFIHKLES